MNIHFNNNNQTSVPDKFPLNKVATTIFNIVTVNGTTNNDVGLSTKINVDIPPIKKVNIPHDESVIVPSNNNNQTSVPDKVSLNKVATTIFNTVTVNSTTNKDVGVPTKINVNIPKRKKFNIPNNEKFNIPSNINEHIPQKKKVNILSNIDEHISTCSSDIDIPSQKNNCRHTTNCK